MKGQIEKLKQLLAVVAPKPWCMRLLFEVTPEDLDLCDEMRNTLPDLLSYIAQLEDRLCKLEAENKEMREWQLRPVVNMLEELKARYFSLADRNRKLERFVAAHDKYWATRHDADGVKLFKIRHALGATVANDVSGSEQEAALKEG